MLSLRSELSLLDGDRRESIRENVAVSLGHHAVCGLPMAGQNDRGG